jgi:hypothetical protein
MTMMMSWYEYASCGHRVGSRVGEITKEICLSRFTDGNVALTYLRMAWPLVS